MGYAVDRKWSDRFIPEICEIVGPKLLVPAPMEIDCQEATDLIVLTARDMRVGARIRKPKYIAQYGGQFTLRLERETGSMTEYEKIMRGWGDWLFYGFGHEDHETGAPSGIMPWSIIHLDNFRYHRFKDWQRRSNGDPALIQSGRGDNHDGTYFIWFEIKSFPEDPPILIASSDETV